MRALSASFAPPAPTWRQTSIHSLFSCDTLKFSWLGGPVPRSQPLQPFRVDLWKLQLCHFGLNNVFCQWSGGSCVFLKVFYCHSTYFACFSRYPGKNHWIGVGRGRYPTFLCMSSHFLDFRAYGSNHWIEFHPFTPGTRKKMVLGETFHIDRDISFSDIRVKGRMCGAPFSFLWQKRNTRNALVGVDPKDVELAGDPCVLVDVGIANSW